MPIHIALYHHVRNSAFLKQQLLDGNPDFEYAFIDATMVVSIVHALAAVYRAINDYLHDRLRSRNVHSEIVFCLSPNNNIAESFRRFGVSESTTSLLVIKVTTAASTTHEFVQQQLESAIGGTALEVSDENIRSLHDLPKLRKAYKLTNVTKSACSIFDGSTASSADNGHDGALDGLKEVEIAVLGAMALRGAS